MHAFLVITLRASQIVSGLALTIFAGARRAVVVSRQRPQPRRLAGAARVRARRPVRARGRCRSSARSSSARRGSSTRRGSASSLVALYLSRTRPGLNVRAVGESPQAADAMGINVVAYRYAHTLAGGAFAGRRRRLLQPRAHAAVGRTASPAAPAGSRSRSSSSPSGGPSSASSARTSSGRSRRCRSRSRRAA